MGPLSHMTAITWNTGVIDPEEAGFFYLPVTPPLFLLISIALAYLQCLPDCCRYVVLQTLI